MNDDTDWIDEEPGEITDVSEVPALCVPAAPPPVPPKYTQEELETARDLARDEIESADSNMNVLRARAVLALRKLTTRQRFIAERLARGVMPSTIAEQLDVSVQTIYAAKRNPKFIRAHALLSEIAVLTSPLGTKAKAINAMGDVYEAGMTEVPIINKEGAVVGYKRESVATSGKMASDAAKIHGGLDADEKKGYAGPEGPGLQIIVNAPGRDSRVGVSEDGRTATIDLPEPE